MRFLLLIITFSALNFKAQDASSNVFHLKPAFGFNGCQVHGDNYSGYDKIGFFLGTAVNSRINEKISVELGFYFSQKGARHNQNPAKGDYRFYRLNLNYLDLPLSLRFTLNPKYFLTMGPSLAYLISYRENIDFTDMTGFYNFNKYEVSVNIGLGRKINEKFSVEFRCTNSITAIRNYGRLSNVFYPNPVARFFNKGFYNNILTLFVAYRLDVRKK